MLTNRRRRAAGEGSWTQRERKLSSGNTARDWVYTVSLGFDERTGRRIRLKFYGKTQTDVREKVHRAKLKAGGHLRKTDPTTVEAYLDSWLAEVEKSKASTTFRFYDSRIRRHAIPKTGPSIGKVRLDDLSSRDIAKLYRQLDERGVSADSVQKLHKTLRRAFNVAIGKGLLDRNPCAFVERRAHRSKKRVVLNAEQIATFFRAIAGHRLEAFFRLAIMDAMRPGELRALAWEDVDLENGIVDVRHNLRDASPKSGKPSALVDAKRGSMRRLPIERETVDVLTRHRAATAAEAHGSPHVFPDRDGSWLDPKGANAELQQICAAEKLPRLTLYNLRHSSVSLFAEAGVHVSVAADIAGHQDKQLTMNVYTHTGEAQHREGIETAAELIRKKNNPAA